MASRRKFSDEYKREAVQLATQRGVTKSQIARELGINANMLGRWCRDFSANGGAAFPGQGKPRDEELASLKRELARVKKERDFLKEAAAFFARESK
jgi:transposase